MILGEIKSLQKIFKFKKIDKNFFVSIFTLISLLLLISYIFSFSLNYKSAKKQLHNDMREILDIAQSPLAGNIWSYELRNIEAIGSALMNYKNIVMVEIVNEYNREMFYDIKQNEALRKKYLTREQRELFYYNYTNVGSLVVVFTSYYVQREIMYIMVRNLLQTMAIIIVLGILIIRVSRTVIKELERRISERTDELKQATELVVETEKMVFLGKIVSGVAHEINTPIGVGVSTASYLKEINEKYHNLLQQGKMTKTDLKQYFLEVDESTNILNNNLYRAAELIKSFKQVTVDQRIDERENFLLKEYIEIIITSLKHEHKKAKHQIFVDCPENLTIYSYPGVISQILSNLIMNSIIHGFKGKENRKINIAVKVLVNTLMIEYCDDGHGISEENQAKIFDLFFTTNKHNGGSGLGLNIVSNLVQHKLRGSIECKSKEGEGTCFIIEIPKK